MKNGSGGRRGDERGRGWATGVFGALLAAALAVPSAALAATVTLYPMASVPVGTVTSPLNALDDNGVPANVSPNNSSLAVSGYDGTDRGTISNVSVYAKYKTSAVPSNDTYQFDAALDGVTYNQSILAPTLANQTAYQTVSMSLGALSWTQVANLAVRGRTIKTGAADAYTLDFDVAYIVVTYTATAPGNPGTPSASLPTSTSSINVSWAASTGSVTSYTLDVDDDPGFGSLFASYSPSGNSQSVTGLSPNTVYYLRVKANGPGGSSGWANGSAATLSATPSAPTFANTGVNSTDVSWSVTGNGPAALTYTVEYANNSGFTGAQTLTGIAGTSTNVSPLSSGTQYWFRVYAVNAGGTSPASGANSVTTLAAPGTPGTPSASLPTSTTSMNVSWAASSGSVTSYTLEVDDDPAFGSLAGSYSPGGTSQSVAGLTPNTVYYLRVKANGPGGSSGWANGSAATLSATPSAPTFANTGANSTDVSWSVTGNGPAALTYTVEYANNSGFTGAQTVSGIAGTTTNVTGLTAGTPYWFRIYAVNAGGTSPASSPGTVTTSSAAPGTPGAPVASLPTSSSSMSVSWTASTGSVTGYTLEVDNDSGFTAPLVGSYSPSGTSQSVTGLTPNTVYYLRVKANGPGGSSGWANGSAATLSATPNTPTFGNTGQNSTDVSWSVTGNGPAAVTYTVEYANNSGFTGAQTVSGIAGTTTNVPGLTAGTQYWLRIYAVNAGGTSPASSPGTVTTSSAVPGTPGAPVASLPTSSSSMSVSWTASTGAVTGYTLEVDNDSGFAAPLVATYSPSGTSQSVSGLVPNTPYYLRVKANGPGGSSGWANGSATTLSATPSAPTFTGTTSSGTTAAWTVSGNGAAAVTYTLEYANNSAFTGSQTATDIVSTSKSVSGLNAQTTYWFRVYAVNAGGTTLASAPGSVTTAAAPPPPNAVVPTTLSAVAESCNRATLRASYTGDANQNATVSFGRGASASGPFAAIAGCQNLAGVVSPRACTEVGNVTPGQTYFYQATFTDLDNSPQPAPIVSAGLLVPACGATLSLSDPGGQPGPTLVEAASVNHLVAKLRLTAANGTVDVSSIRVSNAALPESSRAVSGTDVTALQLWEDLGAAGFQGSGVDTLLVASAWDAASGKYVFQPRLQLASGTSKNLLVTLNVAPGARVGKVFDLQVSSSDITVSTAGASVVIGMTVDAASPATIQAPPIAGSVDPLAPMVSILNPGNGAAVSGTYRVQVQAFDKAGLANVTVWISTNGGSSFVPTPLTQSSKYSVGTNAAVYESTVASPTPGAYKLVARVDNSATGKSVRSNPVLITVNAAGTGDGNLLRRDNAPQLCADCHAMLPHSSQAAADAATGQSRYGSWSTTCRDCHTPHGTTNIYLVKKEITPPPVGSTYQPTKTVYFSDKEKYYSPATPSVDPAQIASAGRANQDYTGICQVCHTRTQDADGNPLWRNDSGIAANHGLGGACRSCHGHNVGFKRPAPMSCTSCHGTEGRPAGPITAETPPKDTCDNLVPQPGSTTNRVGGHQAHLVGSTKTDGVACSECHVDPPVRAGHPGDSCSTVAEQRALMTWGDVARGAVDPWSGAPVTPAWTVGTQTCAATYCHGNFKNSGRSSATVTWNGSVACGDCHALPPSQPTHESTSTACDLCHGTGYTLAGVSGAALTTHVNGQLDRIQTLTCTSCHGSAGRSPLAGVETTDDRYKSAPPTAARMSPAAPATTAHLSHVYNGTTRRPLLCADCHNPTPTSVNHANDTLDLGWSPLAKALGGGDPVYTGSPAYTCAATYCHGANFTAAVKGSGSIPVWTSVDGSYKQCDSCHQSPPTDPVHTSVPKPSTGDVCYACHNTTVLADGSIDLAGGKHVNLAVETGGITCHSCHGDATSDAPPPLADSTNLNADGAHRKHVVAPLGTRTTAYGCTQCHPDNSGNMAHANGTPEMQWTASDAPATVWNDGSSSCTTSYCHGDTSATAPIFKNGLDAGILSRAQNTWGGAAKQPDWTVVNGTYKACTACHGAPPALGSASPHPLNTACDECHPNGASIAGAGSIAGGSDAAANHVNKRVDVKRTGCTACHGDFGQDGVTGGASSNPLAAAPGYFNGTSAGEDVAGATSGTRVGAHKPHMQDTYLRTASIACNECHVVPENGDVAHATGTGSTGARALLTWGPLARGTVAGGTDTNPSYANGTCSNTYCHGATLPGGTLKNPTWTSGTAAHACTACHLDPPAAPHVQRNDCGTASCHGNGYSTSTVNPSLHIDGHVDQFSTSCTACHGDASRSDVTGAPVDPYQKAAPPPDSSGNNAVSSVKVGVHVSHVNSPRSRPVRCTECHTGEMPSSPTDYLHANGSTTIDPSHFGTLAKWGGVAPTYSGGASPTCSATYCHGNFAGGTGSGPTPAWTVAGTLACTVCHGSSGSTSAQTTLSTGHRKHTNTDRYSYGCVRCHSSVVSDNSTISAGGHALHVDGVKNVAFDSYNSLALQYGSGGQYTCSNTYCHSDGKNPTPAANVSIAWNTSSQCSSCHGDQTTNTATLSGAHGKHVANASVIGTNYYCGDCHTATLDAGTNAPVTTVANHVDKTKQVAIATRGGYASTDTTTTCSATYCHSSGQRGGANVKRTVSWTETAWTGNICVKCHGTGGTEFGAPEANGGADTSTANSHPAHVSGSGDCATCHNATTATGTSILAGAPHTNGLITAVFDTAKAGTVTFVSGTYSAPSTYTSATCANVKCHGYNATPVKWGATNVKCSDCHMGSSDTDSFAFGTLGVISTTEWTSVGHGQSTFGANTFPTVAAGTPCLYCHDAAVAHDLGGNPFRLRGATGAGGAVTPGNYSAATATSANAVCLNCHATTGANGVDPDGGGASPLLTSAKKISNNHIGADHGARNGGSRCWDCHDAHGDGTNVKMVESKVVQTSTDNHSWAATRVSGVSFTAYATGTDYAGGPTKVCNACHVTAAHYNATSDGHQSGARCVACHLHDQATNLAFKETTACNGCHNAPPTLGKHLFHDETSFAETAYANNARHATTTQYGYACNTCHNGTHMSSTNPYAVQVVFGSFDSKVVGGTYGTGGAAQTADTAPTAMLTFNWANNGCSATYCHSNAAPLGGTNGTATPTWAETAWVKTGSSANECVKCHAMAADNTGLSSSTNLSHAHYQHTTRYPNDCARCHSGIATGKSDYPTTAASVGDKTLHLNGTKNVAFDSYNSLALAYGSGGQYTCSNTYCHSNGKSPTPAANVSIAWNTSSACSSCHGDQVTNTATLSGAHGKHVANASTIGNNYFCGDCHTATLAAGTNAPVTTVANHVDKTKQVAIAPRGGNASTDTTTTCSATYCHSSGQRGGANVKRTVSWTETPWTGNICVKCHGTGGTEFGAPEANGGADTATANSHPVHVSGSGDCATCHNATTATGTSILTGAVHTNGAITVVFEPLSFGTVTFVAGTYSAPSTYTSSTCANVKCHGYNATPLKWGGPSLSCRDCHFGAAGSANSDLDDYVYNNGAVAKIDPDNWLTSGHGATVNYAQSLNTRANFDNSGATAVDGCLYCHDSATNGGANHGDANNPFRLKNTGGSDGKIGVCLVCHKTGSTGVTVATVNRNASAATKINSTHYGSKHTGTNGKAGGQYCWDCHDPHGDYNYAAGQPIAYMIHERPVMDHTATTGTTDWGIPRTAADLAPTPDFRNNLAWTTAWDWADYVRSVANGGTYRGVCQVCHTQTVHFLNSSWVTTTNGDSTHNTTEGCTLNCHTHQQTGTGTAFAAAGGDCKGCHKVVKGARRQIVTNSGTGGDFIGRSHHVTNGTKSEIVENWDCIVCHAEGKMKANGTETDVTGLHNNGTVNLLNVDDTNNWRGAGNDPTGATYSWPGAASATATDRQNLDTFCLSCHDANGAAATYNMNPTQTTWRTWAGSGRPFNQNDLVTSTTDGTARPPTALYSGNSKTYGTVLNVKAQFDPTGLATPTATNSGHTAAGDTATWQKFSWHALKVFGKSRYTTSTANAGAGVPNTISSARGFTAGNNCAGAACNDTSQVFCSDCHRSDYNAHGTTNAEYLLKCYVTGSAACTADSTDTRGSSDAGDSVCYRCHPKATYVPGGGHGPTNGSDDYESPGTDATATALATGRNTGNGNLFLLGCINCHGGTTFGAIHGTGETITPVGNQAVSRKAWRFMNGSSQSEWIQYMGGSKTWPTGYVNDSGQPQGDNARWSGTSRTWECYTLGASPDRSPAYGSCTHHSTGGATGTGMDRPLNY